jgi:hypothetical protein
MTVRVSPHDNPGEGENKMAGPYDGVHSFAFHLPKDDGASPDELVDALAALTNGEEGPVFFRHRFRPFDEKDPKEFDFFTHTGKDRLEDLSAFYNDELWSAGLHTHSVDELAPYTSSGGVKMGIKRNSPPLCAIARVWVGERPLTVMDRIAKDAFGEDKPFVGVSHVSGPAPLFVELGAESYAELEAAKDQLREVEGVTDVKASWTELKQQGS